MVAEIGDAEIAVIWYPINMTTESRYDKFLQILDEEGGYDVFDLIGKEDALRDAIRTLPAHVVDAVREEFPLSATQLRLLEENRIEKNLFAYDYETI
jgi:hypothetical protein